VDVDNFALLPTERHRRRDIPYNWVLAKKKNSSSSEAHGVDSQMCSVAHHLHQKSGKGFAAQLTDWGYSRVLGKKSRRKAPWLRSKKKSTAHPE